MTEYGAVYIRKSYQPGADNDLEGHLNRCQSIVKDKGLVPRVFREQEGHRSARSEKNRPAFREFLDFITRPECKLAVANDRARIWRDNIKYGEFLKWIKGLGKEFIPATEPAIQDIDTAMGMASEGMMGILNAFYPQYVSDKMRGYYEALRSAGVYHGRRAPLGLKVEGKKHERHLIASDEIYIAPDGTERKYLDTIRQALTLYVREDMGCRLIARILNERGYCWRSKKNKPVAVRTDDVVRTFKNIGQWSGFVDDVLLRQAVAIHARRAEHLVGGRWRRHPVLLLRGVAICAKCDAELSSHTIIKGMYTYSYYVHPIDGDCEWSGRRCSATKLHKCVIEWLVKLGNLPEAEKKRLVVMMTRGPEEPSGAVDIRLQRDKLRKRLSGYEQMLADGDIDRAAFLKSKSQIEHDLKSLAELPEVPNMVVGEQEASMFAQFPDEIIKAGMASQPIATNRVMQLLFSGVKVDIPTDKIVDFVLQEYMLPLLGEVA